MKKFRVLKLIIAVVLAGALFTACADEAPPAAEVDDNNMQADLNGGDNGGQADEADEAAEAEAAWLAAVTPDLPDIAFDGYIFRILNTHNENVPWLLTQLTAEAATGEQFNDAVFRRNTTIEERFDISIEETLVAGLGAVRERAQREIRAGDNEFDLYMLHREYALNLAHDGMLVDYHDIDHIDLTRIYWDQNMVSDLSINNRLFMMAGDFSFTHYSATLAMFFNKGLHADLGLDCPYRLVHGGRWTFDAFHEQARGAVNDLNGDGIFNQHDQFGYMSLYGLVYPTFMFASGERYLVKDADDVPMLAVGGDRWLSVYNAIIDIMHDGNLFFCARTAGNDRFQDTMFPNDQALFWTELMNWAGILRGMDNDFGILPHPKFNEAQDRHYSVVWGCNFMGVPTTTVDLARTGVILEALSAESRKVAMPVYYDIMLTTVIARDEESGEMLDIIFANRVYDFGLQFLESTVVVPFITGANQNNRDVASILEMHGARIETALQRLVDRFDELR